MTYTDSSGRPEIIADPELKLGPAAYEISTVPEAADTNRSDEAAGASTGGAALS
jgi:hypothetical protein